MSSFSLQGKTAMVTGASRGLGREIALGLARAGAQVILVARDGARLAAVADSVHAEGGRAVIETLDLADLAAVETGIAAILGRHAQIDILVNNAGMSQWSAFCDSTLADWQHVFNVNVSSMFLICRDVAKGMAARGFGRIINFGSFVSKLGRPRLAAYTASKHAVVGLTKSIAAELGPFGVTCNVIAPGFFATEMAAPTVGHPERKKIFQSAIAMDRFGDPVEIVGAVIFLASDASSYVTGQVLHVDGGVATILSLPVVVES